MNLLRRLWHYADKVFDLPRYLLSIGSYRSEPEIPNQSITLSLFLGAVMRVGSLLQLQAETARPGWQRLIGWSRPISDDSFGYALERYHLEDLRRVAVQINKTLKRNKAFESAKIHGLLVVAIDANEQFHSRHRCCPACCQRQLELKDAQGQVQTVTEYYHRQVYAQLHGPDFSVILDLEPIRPGEDEAKAALRLLGRMRRLYGPRFFDVITADAWYATEPFLRAVRKLGWHLVAVLKQERYEIYQEATTLSQQQQPVAHRYGDRDIKLWEVRHLSFGQKESSTVRVVLAEERWQQTRRVGARKTQQPCLSHWRWLADDQLEGYGPEVIWRIGHQRWGVENHAFNELTQYYHLTHCPRHEPVAIVAWLLFLVLGFTMFELFVRLHGKLWHQGKTTLKEIALQIYRALESQHELQPLWSG